MTPDMERALSKAARKVREGRDAAVERDRLIREAVHAGWSLRKVASAVGLSHVQVKNIADAGRDDE